MKLAFFIGFIIFPLLGCAGQTQYFDTQKAQFLDEKSLIQSLPSSGFMVLGEFHNDQKIQDAQANLIAKKVNFENAQADFSLNWEFVNYTDQVTTSSYFQQFKNDEITIRRFIELTAGKQNMTYAPLLEQTKKLKGEFFGINLPRDIKQKVIKEGINSIDPKYVPDFHYDGGADYKERFVKVMGDHVPADKIDAYFTAQCLTDSVMAREAHKNGKYKLNFLVAGSFHTDFYDATVVRLKSLTSENITTFKFVNAHNISSDELKDYLQGDKKYGAYADFIVIVK